MESASESNVVNFDIVLAVFAALIIVGLVTGLFNKYGSTRRYKDIERYGY